MFSLFISSSISLLPPFFFFCSSFLSLLELIELQFVARSLAHGGFIPGLGGYSSQSSYLNWSYKGYSFDAPALN
jgi:hypothetical protein